MLSGARLAHEQDNVIALQPAHSGTGGWVIWNRAGCADVNSLKSWVGMRQLKSSWLLCEASHFVWITPVTVVLSVCIYNNTY